MKILLDEFEKEGVSLTDFLEKINLDLTMQALELTKFRQRDAAKILGISRQVLYRTLHKHERYEFAKTERARLDPKTSGESP